MAGAVRAIIDVGFAILPFKTFHTIAKIGVVAIFTGSPVGTGAVCAIVDVGFAISAFVTIGAVAGVVIYRVDAGSTVFAGVAGAIVDVVTIQAVVVQDVAIVTAAYETT